jgi:GMP synthase (glutamine-hydrolysing)
MVSLPHLRCPLRSLRACLGVLCLAGLLRTLSQVPVVLFPVNFGAKDKEGSAAAATHSIALRTFITNDFMTGVPAVPGRDIPEAVLDSIVEQILAEVPGVARVCYDLTSKPPATTEWE